MLERTCVTAAVLALVGPAAGQFFSVTDDLTDGSFDPFFSYDFSSDFAGNGMGGDFNQLDGQGLLLGADEVLITFPNVDGSIGGRVLFVDVEYIDVSGVGDTSWEVIGSFSSRSGSNNSVNQVESFDVGNFAVGALISVRIGGLETYVRSITARYEVPAPAGAMALGLVGLAAARRRR